MWRLEDVLDFEENICVVRGCLCLELRVELYW